MHDKFIYLFFICSDIIQVSAKSAEGRNKKSGGK
jgi:hypothetical protein